MFGSFHFSGSVQLFSWNVVKRHNVSAVLTFLSLLELESHQPSKRIDHSEPQDICENPIIKESHLQFNF